MANIKMQHQKKKKSGLCCLSLIPIDRKGSGVLTFLTGLFVSEDIPDKVIFKKHYLQSLFSNDRKQ